MNDSRLLDAERVLAKRAAPSYSKHDYENAMVDIARAEARDGESHHSAFARLCKSGDRRMSALYAAARTAGLAATGDRSAARGQLQELLKKVAATKARPGEPVGDAVVRLLREGDEAVTAAYNVYRDVG